MKLTTHLTALALGAAMTLGAAATTMAQDIKFFTIGTGGTAYTYYPVGGVIAKQQERKYINYLIVKSSKLIYDWTIVT